MSSLVTICRVTAPNRFAAGTERSCSVFVTVPLCLNLHDYVVRLVTSCSVHPQPVRIRLDIIHIYYLISRLPAVSVSSSHLRVASCHSHGSSPDRLPYFFPASPCYLYPFDQCNVDPFHHARSRRLRTSPIQQLRTAGTLLTDVWLLICRRAGAGAGAGAGGRGGGCLDPALRGQTDSGHGARACLAYPVVLTTPRPWHALRHSCEVHHVMAVRCTTSRDHHTTSRSHTKDGGHTPVVRRSRMPSRSPSQRRPTAHKKSPDPLQINARAGIPPDILKPPDESSGVRF